MTVICKEVGDPSGPGGVGAGPALDSSWEISPRLGSVQKGQHLTAVPGAPGAQSLHPFRRAPPSPRSPLHRRLASCLLSKDPAFSSSLLASGKGASVSGCPFCF